MYLLFTTLEQAQAAQAQIDSNIVAVLTEKEPEIVSDTGIIGRNAATGELDYNAARTTTWSEPTECADGWYLVKPVMNHYYFVGVNLLAGVEDYEDVEGITPLQPEEMIDELGEENTVDVEAIAPLALPDEIASEEEVEYE